MSGFISEAFAQAAKDVTPQITNNELIGGFVILLICGIGGASAGYYLLYKDKPFVPFIYLGHMFLSLVAGFLAFLSCFVYGWFDISGTKIEILKSFSKTGIVIIFMCLVGTDALAIIRKFIKNNLLSFLERIMKAMEKKA